MPNPALIREQYDDLVDKGYHLSLVEGENGFFIVKGELEVSASHEKVDIKDSFLIEIFIPAEYPGKPPIAKEVGNRIPLKFHKYKDNSLCLSAPVEVRKVFAEYPSLIGFVEKLLTPYLYNFCIWEKTGIVPFGELSHGGKGILEYYKEKFGASTDVEALRILRILAEDSYRGHLPCPCESGNNLRQCHGNLLLEFRKYQSIQEFFAEYYQCVFYIFSYDKYSLKPFLSGKFKKLALRYEIENGLPNQSLSLSFP